MIGRRNNISHNACLKVYKNGYTVLSVSDHNVFNESGFERSFDEDGFERSEDRLNSSELDIKKVSDRERSDNIRRSIQKVFDIGMLNDFKYFITWTLDKSKINRYDPIEVSKKVKIFLKNMSLRHNLVYILIPEHHKDGAIHMHGLISGDMEFIDSGKTTNSGRIIYNMPQWKYGWSTAIEIYDQPDRVCKYITKYITKDCSDKIFGNYYYAGGNGLVREPRKIVFDLPYNLIDSKEYLSKICGIGFKYVTNCSDDLLNKYINI